MKITSILASLILLTSCVDNEVIIIDGCEYVQTTTYSNGLRQTLTHKGNCKNPIHIYKQKEEIKYDSIPNKLQILIIDSIK